MKRTVASSCLFFVLLITIQAQDKVYTTDNIPNVRLRDKTRYVCDPSGILSAETTGAMDNLLYNLEQRTGIETAVVVVPSIGDADCFEFSHRLLNQWGVGKSGKDNGLVILLVTDQRCIQFYTGYGLEGVLPDAICKRIQTRDMIPYLKNGDWNNGMAAGIRAVCNKLDGSMENEGKEENEDTKSILMILLAIFGLVVILLGISFYVAWKVTRCPRCGKHQLQRTGSRIISRQNGVKTEELTYTCRHCGYSLTRQHQSYDENYRNRGGGGMGPVIGGGLGGFGRGGGGFGGGSFGGGRGGGGGAGSRF
jgi:uncharacterized protein